MIGTNHKLSIIVPTKDHPDDLRRLLLSLSAQTVFPDEVIVVDGGSNPVEAVVREKWPFVTAYERVYPPWLAKQQNAGIRRVSRLSTLVAFVDDDIVLAHDALVAMISFWGQADKDVGGAAFNLINNTGRPRYVWLKSLFGMDSKTRGILLRSGYNTKIGAVDQTTEVQWLYSGATVWRREILDVFHFDEWFEGPGHIYEVEFCFRIGERYRMVVVANARAEEISPTRSWNDQLLGRWQILNRLYFVYKHRGKRGLSLALCWLALTCQFLVNLSRAVFDMDRRYLRRAIGNGTGFIDALRMLFGSAQNIAPCNSFLNSSVHRNDPKL